MNCAGRRKRTQPLAERWPGGREGGLENSYAPRFKKRISSSMKYACTRRDKHTNEVSS